MINRLSESFVTESGKRVWARDEALAEWDMDWRRWYTAVEKQVSENPALCLMGAFFAGAAIAWWIKRR